MDAQIRVLPKHGKWLVKLAVDTYLGPYSYGDAIVTSEVLASAAWQLGYNSSVVLEDRRGERRTIWSHPKQRHEAYA